MKKCWIIPLLLLSYQGVGDDTPNLSKSTLERPSTIYARGRIEPVGRVRELGFERVGRLENVTVEEGQRLAAGDVIADLSNEAEVAAVALCLANVTLAVARLAELEKRVKPEELTFARAKVEADRARNLLAIEDAERAENLFKSSVVSRQDMDRAVAVRTSSGADLRASEAELARLTNFVTSEMLSVSREEVAVAEAEQRFAEAEMEKTVLRAPSNGTVLRVNLARGDLFLPDGGYPLCLYADLEFLRVRAEVDEIHIAQLREGQDAVVRGRGLGDVSLRGRVTKLLPVMGNRRMFTRFPEERLDLDVQEFFVDLLVPCAAPVGLEVDIEILGDVPPRAPKVD